MTKPARPAGLARIIAKRILGNRWLVALELRNKLLLGRSALALRRLEDAEVRRIADQAGQLRRVRVAVVTATYRRPELLVRAVQSALAQTERNLVVVVVDDGGGLPELPSDPRLYACSLSANTGVLGLVLNVGIRLTRSTYVAFLDDDNEWEPDHLELALAALEERPPHERPDVVYTALRRSTPDGQLIDVLSTPFDRKLLARKAYIDTNSLVIRRFPGLHFSRIRRPRWAQPREDWELVYRLARRCRMQHVPVPTVRYRVNPDSYFTDWTGIAPAAPDHAQRAPDHQASTPIDCGIIVVTYNSAQHVEQLLDSLPAATHGLRTRCIVVDNNSQDSTMSLLRSRDDVVAIDAGGNLGYAGAINLGRTLIGPCSSVLILNPDLTLEPAAVVRLHETLDQAGTGVAVPMVLSYDGGLFPSMRREASITRALGDALFGAHWPRRPGWLSDTIHDRLAYQQPRDAAWASGAALLISAGCNEAAGDWDSQRFFLYSEEADFAVRARRCGYRIRYTPSARVRHEGGGSGRSPALGALLAVNRIRYYEKHHRRPATSLFRAAVTLHYLLRSADPGERIALRVLVRRSRWSGLPGGDRAEGQTAADPARSRTAPGGGPLAEAGPVLTGRRADS